MLRIRLDIEQISTITAQVTSQTAQERAILRKEILGGLASHREGVVENINGLYRQLDERISKVEGVLKAPPNEARQSPSNSTMVTQKRRPTGRDCIHQCSQELPTSKDSTNNPHSEGLRICLKRRTSSCLVGCNCICHVARKSSTPAMVDRLLGQLFVGYAGMPFLTAKCDAEGCRKSQIPWISLEYWFPLGYFWSQIFRLQVAYQSNLGPQVSLSTLRRVPDTALSIKYALTGNIEGLQTLFARGLASPVDVDSSRGYSLLSVSMPCFAASSGY